MTSGHNHPPPPLAPGDRIDKYELVRRLDHGGMAELWIARNDLSDRAQKHVALKVIASHLVHERRYARMFEAEAEVVARLNHVNIVQVFDYGLHEGRPYLVMEWVDGINLRKLQSSLGGVAEERRFRIACYVLEQLLHALRYAHAVITPDGQSIGIVHRDVTPQNVMVSNNGGVKLTDFGIATHIFEQTSGLHVKGKVRYMAPEQLAGQTRGKTIDIYGAGAIFHELLDGRRFRGHAENDRELYLEILDGAIPELSCDVPPDLDDLRLGLLQSDPDDRIQSADEALDLLCRVPRHGDPRRELMQLCTGITGIVVPRSGPTPSSPFPVTPGRAIKRKFQGSKSTRIDPDLAKPRPPPPPPSSSRSHEDGEPASDEIPVVVANEDDPATRPTNDGPEASKTHNQPPRQRSPRSQQRASAATSGSLPQSKPRTFPEHRRDTRPSPRDQGQAREARDITEPDANDSSSSITGTERLPQERNPLTRYSLLILAALVLMVSTVTLTWIIIDDPEDIDDRTVPAVERVPPKGHNKAIPTSETGGSGDEGNGEDSGGAKGSEDSDDGPPPPPPPPPKPEPEPEEERRVRLKCRIAKSGIPKLFVKDPKTRKRVSVSKPRPWKCHQNERVLIRWSSSEDGPLKKYRSPKIKDDSFILFTPQGPIVKRAQ